MYYFEALNFPLDYMNTTNLQGFKVHHCNKQKVSMFPSKTVGETSWQVVERIEEYSQKTLSRESDRLNGIRGIFRALEACSLFITCGMFLLYSYPIQLTEIWHPKFGYQGSWLASGGTQKIHRTDELASQVCRGLAEEAA